MPKRSSTRLDANELAFRIVQDATGEEDQDAPDAVSRAKNMNAVNLGRLGGLKGGAARRDALSPERRQEIAKAAAAARWAKVNPESE